MKNNWQPSESDLAWMKNTMRLLKTGGVWLCPAGFSFITKVTDLEFTFMGPLYDDDKLPDEVPTEIAEVALESCLLCNRRIILSMELLGWTIVHAETNKPITTNPDWDLT